MTGDNTTLQPWAGEAFRRSRRFQREGFALLTASKRYSVPLLRWRDKHDRQIFSALLILFFAFAILEILRATQDLIRFDWFGTTGFLVGLIFLSRTRYLRREYNRTINRLVERGALRFQARSRGIRASSKDVKIAQPTLRIKRSVERLASVCSIAGGLLFGLLAVSFYEEMWRSLGGVLPGWPQIQGAWAAVPADYGAAGFLPGLLGFLSVAVVWPLKLTTTALGTAISFFCGMRLARMACYGALGTRLHRLRFLGHRIRFNPLPGHVDGRCGLKPIGDFICFQIESVILPFCYLLFWYAMMVFFVETPLWKLNPVYQNQFLIAALAILALQVVGLLWPVFSIRRHIHRRKIGYEHEADTVCREINRLEAVLRDTNVADERDQITSVIEAKRSQYDVIENMQIWPISAKKYGPAMLLFGQIPAFLGTIGIENADILNQLQAWSTLSAGQ